MSTSFSTANDDSLLAAALSAILGKEILSQSSVSPQSQHYINKVSLFDQHLISFVYGEDAIDKSTNNTLLMKINITVFTTKKTFPCIIERNASVDKLKQIIYEKEGILCSKQNLIYCGQEIDEGHLLSEYGIGDSSQIFIVRLKAMNANDLLVIDENSRDHRYDYDFTNINDEGKRFSRGGVEYCRPCGWKRYAIRVKGKYENEVWLGSKDNPDEWPVSYHGTGQDAAKTIAQMGFDLGKHTRHLHGRGIYSTPDLSVAKGFAKRFIVKDETYLVILQNRVNPKTVEKHSHAKTGNGEYWISPTEADIRPYGVCIMKQQ